MTNFLHALAAVLAGNAVAVHDIEFTKKTDAASPLLFLNCANGAHIKEATFVVRKAGGEQLEYLKIKLTDVLISSYKPHGIAAEDNWLIGNASANATGMADGSVVPNAGGIPSEQFSLKSLIYLTVG